MSIDISYDNETIFSNDNKKIHIVCVTTDTPEQKLIRITYDKLEWKFIWIINNKDNTLEVIVKMRKKRKTLKERIKKVTCLLLSCFDHLFFYSLFGVALVAFTNIIFTLN